MTCYEQIISLYKEESCTPKDWRNHTLTDCRCEDKELLVLFKPLFVNIQLITIKQALCCTQFSLIYVIDPFKKKNPCEPRMNIILDFQIHNVWFPFRL